MTWRDTWAALVGLAGIAAAVVVVWLIGASVARRLMDETGPFERYEWPLVWLIGFVSVIVAGGLLTAAYELGCAVVGCAA